jgi:dolichyl-phosphate-mannose--protein O-mannosyl transferase
MLHGYRGYEQQEVTCNPNLRDAAAVWNVEDNRFPRCMSILKCILFKENN